MDWATQDLRSQRLTLERVPGWAEVRSRVSAGIHSHLNSMCLRGPNDLDKWAKLGQSPITITRI
jgi:hypothetical protein